jgi:hypothetical protein
MGRDLPRPRKRGTLAGSGTRCASWIRGFPFQQTEASSGVQCLWKWDRLSVEFRRGVMFRLTIPPRWGSNPGAWHGYRHCAPLGLGFVLFAIFVERSSSSRKTRQKRVHHEEHEGHEEGHSRLSLRVPRLCANFFSHTGPPKPAKFRAQARRSRRGANVMFFSVRSASPRELFPSHESPFHFGIPPRMKMHGAGRARSPLRAARPGAALRGLSALPSFG